ncbi:MAG: DUF4097 family beta strand repeat-containing protein [Terriglobia bacterium]
MIKRLNNKRNLWLILLVAMAPAGAYGSGPFQRTTTFYTTRTPRISVTNLTGTVVIRGWDRPQVSAVYVIASPRIEIDTEQVPSQGEAEKIQLATHLLDRSLQGANARVDYTLEVPMGASLEIRNSQGSVRIDSLSGDTWVQSVGGDIFISGASGQIIAHSLGGKIEIDRASGYVEASSVTGNLKFISPTSSQIHASTTSGQISYEGKLVPAGDYVMSTYNGNIDFLCPPSSSFELHARSVHGKLDNQLKLVSKEHHSSVSSYGTALFGMHNQGTATLELTSFRGTIRISPQPQQ